MGYIRHHAIMVTGSDYDDRLASVHKTAKEIFGELVSPIIESKINGYLSFFIAPDGSKEGWDISDEGNNNRAEFKRKVAIHNGYVDWVEVQYGDDECVTCIIDHSDAEWQEAQ